MKFNKLISSVLTAALALQLFVAGVSAAIVKTENTNPVNPDNAWTPPLSISEPLPEGNVLRSISAMDTETTLARNFSANGQVLSYHEDANGGYVKASGITLAYLGFTYQSLYEVSAGKYRFTGYFRTANEGEITMLRVNFIDLNNETTTFRVYCGDEWVKAEFYVELADSLNYIKINGGPLNELIQDYCMDHFSLVPVDEIPAGAKTECGDTLGLDATAYAVYSKELQYAANGVTKYDPEKEAQYEVGGIIINSDCTQFVSSASGETCTEDDIINFAKQFEGTHVTDYFMNVAAWTTVYPSDKYTDFVEKYHLTEDRGQTVDYTTDSVVRGAHHIFETLATDYFGLWHEAFREVGINPWISFRMNDFHETANAYMGAPSYSMGDFYYDNPDYIRVKHHPVSNSTTNFNYAIPEVREYFLGLIEEGIARYGSYGIELDFMREIWLFHPGGEYNALDTMTEFMREVNDILSVYEVRYGHDIKVAVRTPSDIQTTYDFGLDVVTWAAEGLLDMVIPTSRWETTDMDIPVKVWDSMMTPFDVMVCPGTEQRLQTWQGASLGGHSVETFAAFAANAFTQGADKIYCYNFFLGVNDVFTDDIKLTTDAPNVLTGLADYWNIITSAGSYDKVMTMNRRHMITYNDINAAWERRNQYLPASIGNYSFTTLRVAVGDVPEGARLILKMAANNAKAFENPPTVYVNSQLCEYIGSEYCTKANSGVAYSTFTKNKMLCYEIPVEAHNEVYMLIEAKTNEKNLSFTTDHVEVYVQAHN